MIEKPENGTRKIVPYIRQSRTESYKEKGIKGALFLLVCGLFAPQFMAAGKWVISAPITAVWLAFGLAVAYLFLRKLVRAIGGDS